MDFDVLRGSTVRDNAGATGQILTLSLPWVTIGWYEDNATREESMLRSDPRLETLEIHTLTGGWQCARNLIGAKTEEVQVESVEVPQSHSGRVRILAEALILEAKKPRSPFKTATKTGPGPRGRVTRKRDFWTCSGSNYKYVCHGKDGSIKKIKRDPDMKKAYQKGYKKWWRGKHVTSAPSLHMAKHKSRGVEAKKKKLRAARVARKVSTAKKAARLKQIKSAHKRLQKAKKSKPAKKSKKAPKSKKRK